MKSPEGLLITMEWEERGPNPVENWNSHVTRTRKCEGRARAVLEHVTQSSLCEVCRALFLFFSCRIFLSSSSSALSFEDVQSRRYKVSKVLNHAPCNTLNILSAVAHKVRSH